MDVLTIDIALPRRAFELCAGLSVGAETVALVGPSGAGKTSLLRAVAGLEHPRAGRIALGAEEWFSAENRIYVAAERRRVGYLPQDYGLFPHLNVAQNVRFAARRDRPDLLERLGIDHLAQANPRQLSGGERQRTALARALARDPRVLLLDEPFAALDATTRRQVRDQLADLLRTLRLSALVVTHTFEDAAVLAQRIGVLDRGEIVQLAHAAELINDPASATVAALTGSNVLAGEASPASSGSSIRLADGGELASSITASGPVQIAIQPWQLALVPVASSSLIDRVISVRQDGGRVLVRLTRFTVQLELTPAGAPPPREGEEVGVRAAPDDVRIVGR